MGHKVRKNDEKIDDFRLDYGSIRTNAKTKCNYSCVTLSSSFFDIVIVIPYI
jgi:hypothetical protein